MLPPATRYTAPPPAPELFGGGGGNGKPPPPAPCWPPQPPRRCDGVVPPAGAIPWTPCPLSPVPPSPPLVTNDAPAPPPPPPCMPLRGACTHGMHSIDPAAAPTVPPRWLP